MINDAAVEAAAKQVWRDSAAGRRTCEAWEGLSDSEQRPCIDAARTILEAAAPHMLAPVLEVADRLAATELTGDNYHQGRASGFRMAAEHIRQATNPYRSQVFRK